MAFDRYAYVRNSPAMYTDPSGHDFCHGPVGAIECLDAGDPYEFPNEPPPGLSDGGLIAWKNMYTMSELAKEAGITMTDEEWLAFIIASEYLGSIGPDPTMNAAMARRYRDYCSGGMWSSGCFNGFWGYMQATVSGSLYTFNYWIINPTNSSMVTDNWKTANAIAHAILNPILPNDFQITSAMNSCANQKCDWVTITPNNSKWADAINSSDIAKWFTADGKLFLLLTDVQLTNLCGGKRCNLTTFEPEEEK